MGLSSHIRRRHVRLLFSREKYQINKNPKFSHFFIIEKYIFQHKKCAYKMPPKFFPTFNFFLRRIFWSSNYMEHNHNKKIGGLWLRFQDTGQWCVAFLTKNWQFYVIFGTICMIAQNPKEFVNNILNKKTRKMYCCYVELNNISMKLFVIEILHIL